MSDDEKKPFTVTDRRHFTADGDARPENEPEPERSDAPPASAVAEPPVSRASEPALGELPAPDFGTLLLSLGSQASMLLGLGPEGAEGGIDLRGARDIISLLEVLADKTRGNRTDDEDRLLEGLLYELRMAFVARSRVGA